MSGAASATSELVKVIKALLLNKKPDIPNYPVCVNARWLAISVSMKRADMSRAGYQGRVQRGMYKQRQILLGLLRTG